MSSRRLWWLGAAFLIVAAAAGYATRIAQQQRTELDALAGRARQLAAGAAALRREKNATARDLAQAEAQLAALPPLASHEPALAPGRQTEMVAWLARTKRLRALFAERPDQRIPEIQFLGDNDWLRLSHHMNLEGEDAIRRALAQVRSNAVSKFMEGFGDAVRKYIAANKGARPPNVQALAGYIAKPVDALLLMRYEITDRPSMLGSGANWVVANAQPVDPDYDTRFYIGEHGSASNSGVMAWIPGLDERYRQAARAYARANPKDTKRTMEKIIPYFDPPLDPDLAVRVIRSERNP